MDYRQVLVDVNSRLRLLYSRILSRRSRIIFEDFLLINCVIFLFMLCSTHKQFVGKPTCAEYLVNPSVLRANVVQIQITGISKHLADDWFHFMRMTLIRLQKTKFKGRHWLQGYRLHKDNPLFRFFDCFQGSFLKAKKCIHSMFLYGCTWWRKEKSAKEVLLKPDFKETTCENLQGEGLCESQSSKDSENFVAGDSWMALITKFWNRLYFSTKDLWFLELKNFREGLENQKATFGNGFQPGFLYSEEKGFLLLYQNPSTNHLLTSVNVSIPVNASCLGGRFHTTIIGNVMGYETLLLNSLLTLKGKGDQLNLTENQLLSNITILQVTGFFQNLQTKEIYSLKLAGVSENSSWQEKVMFKFGVLLTSLYVFSTTSLALSFIMRETQSRMIRFTRNLQNLARLGLPTVNLITLHVIEILVFVPISIGILFVLFEFFEDQLLAFLFLSVLWICEVLMMVSVQAYRPSSPMRFLPCFTGLYLIAFLIYHFSFTYGFSYLAFFTSTSFLQHTITYFWNRYED